MKMKKIVILIYLNSQSKSVTIQMFSQYNHLLLRFYLIFCDSHIKKEDFDKYIDQKYFNNFFTNRSVITIRLIMIKVL